MAAFLHLEIAQLCLRRRALPCGRISVLNAQVIPGHDTSPGFFYAVDRSFHALEPDETGVLGRASTGRLVASVPRVGIRFPCHRGCAPSASEWPLPAVAHCAHG